MSGTEKIIIRALLYSDIFDYPLTKEELWKYMVGAPRSAGLPLQKKDFFRTLQKKTQGYSYHDGFYFLKHRQDTVSLRLDRQQIATKKIVIAKRVSKLLSLIPSICFIGITGTLSMFNTDNEDDIDFFIITQQNSIWITRLLILLILECIGKRRKRGETKAQDKICVNLFIDESQLSLPMQYRDLYTAHEVVQIKPLFERSNTYKRFLAENMWVKEYLPNALPSDTSLRGGTTKQSRESEHSLFTTRLLHPAQTGFAMTFEGIAKKLQLWYMKKQYTSEIITDTILAFYEGSTRRRILSEYKKRLRRYKISNF